MARGASATAGALPPRRRMGFRRAVPPPQQPTKRERRWTLLKRALTLAFALAVAALLARYAAAVDWPGVGRAVVDVPLDVLAAAAALAALSHLIYSGFDLFGRHYTRHRLPVPRVMAITFVSYAFNLNLGSLIGGIAFRYRLYARSGLANSTTTRVMLMSMATNWLGYLLLGGLLFAFDPFELPDGWAIGQAELRLVGVLMVAVALAYAAAVLWSKRRVFVLRGRTIELPHARLAALQFAASMTNWAVMGALVTVLLQGAVDYPTVLGVLLVAAVAGLLTHIPAGLGVLEAVFVALLSPPVATTTLLAALLVYRVLYYIVPLALAAGGYVLLETRARPAAAR